MVITLLAVYAIAYFVGNLGAAGVNLLAKRTLVPRRTAGTVLVLCISAFYLYVTARAFAGLDTSRLSSYDQGRVAGEVFANVLLPLLVVMACIAAGARRDRRRRDQARASTPTRRIDPS